MVGIVRQNYSGSIEDYKEAWARWGIELWPAGGKSAWDRAIGEYPVDRPDLNPLDQSIHASWKTRRGGLYDRWRSRKESRRTPGGFYNEVTNSWSDMPQHLIHNAIDAQRDIIREAHQIKGKRTSYL